MHEEPDISVKDDSYQGYGRGRYTSHLYRARLGRFLCRLLLWRALSALYKGSLRLTLVVSVMLIGFVALTLTPALAAIMLKRGENKPFWIVQKFNDFFDWSTKMFSAGVAKVLRHVIPSLIIVAVVIFAMSGLFKTSSSSLVPSEDKGYFMVISSLPPASAIARTVKRIKR